MKSFETTHSYVVSIQGIGDRIVTATTSHHAKQVAISKYPNGTGYNTLRKVKGS